MATARTDSIRLPTAYGARKRLGSLRPGAVFLVLAAAAVGWLMHEGRGVSFQSDEWDWMLHRRGHSLDVFLRPHTEHLSALPIALYKLFFSVFGVYSTAPYRLVDALLVVTCAGLTFVLLARRIGGWAALGPAAILLVFGPAWNDIIWGFQIGYMASLAAGLGAFIALERHDRRGDVLAGVLLTVGLACSSVGLTVLAGAIVEVVVTARRRGWSRLWVVAVPTFLYLIWYSQYGVSAVQLRNADLIPNYAFTALAAVSGSITGLTQPVITPYTVSVDPGTSIAVVLLVGLGIRFLRGRPLPLRFWAVATVALAFWVAAALSYIPGREADQSRYTLPAAPMVMLAVAECAAGWRPNSRWLLVLGVGSAAAIGSNLGFLHEGAQLFDVTSQYARAELGAMETARPNVLPSFQPESGAISAIIGVHNMTPIDAASYFSATAAFGSPADSVPTILRQPEAVREAADLVLAKAERLALAPASTPATSCRTQTPAGGYVELTLGPGALTLRPVRSPITAVALRRFASSYNFVSLGRVPAGAHEALTLPRDSSSLPWRLRLTSRSAITVCGA